MGWRADIAREEEEREAARAALAAMSPGERVFFWLPRLYVMAMIVLVVLVLFAPWVVRPLFDLWRG